MSETVCYLRKGRKLRATGEVIWKDGDGLRKVKPARKDWSAVIVTPEEIEAANHKGPRIERKSPASPPEPKKREKKPKPAPVPRWKQLVDQARVMEIDHIPEGWPAVKMRFISELADELEKAQTLFQTND